MITLTPGPHDLNDRFVWVTREGRALLPTEFEDDHLVNAAALCQRALNKVESLQALCCDGDCHHPCHACRVGVVLCARAERYEYALAVLSDEVSRRATERPRRVPSPATDLLRPSR